MEDLNFSSSYLSPFLSQPPPTLVMKNLLYMYCLLASDCVLMFVSVIVCNSSALDGQIQSAALDNMI